MLYKAKTLVTYNGILKAIGDVFDVAPEDASAFGWNEPNQTVEAYVGEYVPDAPETPAEVVPEVPADPTQPTSPEPTPEAPVTPEVAPETPADPATITPETPAEGAGDGGTI